MGWTKRHRPYTKELLFLPLLPFLLLVATANAYEIEESSSSESTEEYEQTDSYPPVEQGRAGVSDVCEEEVQKWMCIDLVNSDSATVSGPRVTDFPTVPEVKYEKLSQTIARVPPNATIQVTCSQVKVPSPTFNCSHDYLMINSARFCNNNFPQAPFTFTSGNPGSQESMVVLKTANPKRAAYSCQLQVVRRYPKRVIDLIKHVEHTLDVSGTAYRQETDFVILAPKKSFVVMSCPVFELASSPKDRVQCVLHRIAGKKTACVESPNTPTYVGAPEQRAQICINMVASPIVKIVSPFRDEMETEMDMTVRYEVMSVPHMVHYLWCNDFRLDTDCAKERLHWFNYNDRLCGHSRPRDFTYSYGHVEDKATYSLTYKKQRGVRQGHFSCFLYREPQTKGTYTLDLFSKNSATIEKHSAKRIFPHDSQVITYYVLAPPDSEINDRQYCDSNVPGRIRLELTYNYATVVFRDGKDASNSFKCTFERGSSMDKCAFEKKPPTTTLTPWETVPTTEAFDERESVIPRGRIYDSISTKDPQVYQQQSHQYHLVFLASLLRSFPQCQEESQYQRPRLAVGHLIPKENSRRSSRQFHQGYQLQKQCRPVFQVNLLLSFRQYLLGVSVPESQTSSPPSFPYSQFTTPFPPGPSGVPATESPIPSGVPGQPTAVVPSVSVGVSVPETETGSRPSYPHGEFTTQFPSAPSGLPTTETMPSGVPGQPTVVVPSVSVGCLSARGPNQQSTVFPLFTIYDSISTRALRCTSNRVTNTIWCSWPAYCGRSLSVSRSLSTRDRDWQSAILSSRRIHDAVPVSSIRGTNYRNNAAWCSWSTYCCRSVSICWRLSA
ncbi:hypothetical protein MTO96_008834 [Rhipicephalus appendiculatus]